MKKLILGCLALLSAAPVLAADLVIDLRTNWVPHEDFRFVRVEVMDRTDERNQWRTLGHLRQVDLRPPQTPVSCP